MDNQVFYVVEPSQMRFSFSVMSLQMRRDRLGELVRSKGAEWAGLRVRGPVFMHAVQRLDRFLGAEEELVNSAFENSPQQMLPIGSSGKYDPLFGYYEPDRVQRFNQQLNAIPPGVMQGWENGADGDSMGRVVYAFRSTFAEAARRRLSVAIEHC